MPTPRSLSRRIKHNSPRECQVRRSGNDESMLTLLHENRSRRSHCVSGMKAKARIAPWGRITGVLCTVVLVTHGQECVFDRDCSDGDPAGRQDPAFNSGTGPIAGQTGAVTDQYIYLNSSGPSSSSRVSTPTLNLPNGGSFSFHYHMFGPEVLSLTVISTLVNGTAVPLFSISGQQHSSHTAPWTRVERDLHPNTTQVTWVASSLSVGGGDIGLDAIAISDTITGVTAAPTLAPTSRPTASGTVFQCSFDTPTSGSNPFLCGLTVSPRWGTTTGRTPSSNTGPNAGQFGLTDRYCFLEASSTAVVDQFVTSPTFVLAVPGHVTFFYHVCSPLPRTTSRFAALIALCVGSCADHFAAHRCLGPTWATSPWNPGVGLGVLSPASSFGDSNSHLVLRTGGLPR